MILHPIEHDVREVSMVVSPAFVPLAKKTCSYRITLQTVKYHPNPKGIGTTHLSSSSKENTSLFSFQSDEVV